MGMPIPANMVLKRFIDEDGEIFLELRGMADYYIRVSDGDRFQYKIEKQHMGEEVLELQEDYSHKEFEVHISEQPTAVTRIVDYANPFDIGDMNIFGSSDDQSSDKLQSTASGTQESPGTLDKDDEILEFKEGETLPIGFRSICKRNEYGGFTLKYKKFIYLMNKKYCIEIKTQDTSYNFNFESQPASPSPPPQPFSVEPSSSQTVERAAAILELDRGDVLPYRYQSQCEEDLGPGGGSRVTIGSFIYFLDAGFKVIQKMKISYATPSPAPPTSMPPSTLPPQAVETPRPLKATPPTPIKKAEKRDIPLKDQVRNIAKAVLNSLKQYGVSADYFKESVFGKHNYDTLIRAFNGDLTRLNDDTKEAAKQGKRLLLQENGFTLFKAVLIHELYIKSTLSGRGDNMKNFLTHIAAVNADGSLEPFQDQSTDERKAQIMDFFKGRANIYTDKRDMIMRVYHQIRPSILHDFKTLIKKGEDLRFDAFLISKLYEYTTRLDRGDGVTMIRLTRAILKYTRLT